MVRGLDLFVKHFDGFLDSFVIIGGTACDLFLSGTRVTPRATKDIDMVLLIEVIDNKFNSVFHSFIRDAGYKNLRSDGSKQFYRFMNPENAAYPEKIEIFSRKPDMIDLGEQHIVPVQKNETISLSAILLDDEYYGLIKDNRVVIDGLPVIKEEYLIPLKAKAYIDNLQRKENGGDVISEDINKHKNDIFRIYADIPADTNVVLAESVKSDLAACLERLKTEDINMKQLKIGWIKKEQAIENIARMFNL